MARATDVRYLSSPINLDPGIENILPKSKTDNAATIGGKKFNK